MIFVSTRRKVEWLTQQMHGRDFTCSALHAELEQVVLPLPVGGVPLPCLLTVIHPLPSSLSSPSAS